MLSKLPYDYIIDDLIKDQYCLPTYILICPCYGEI